MTPAAVGVLLGSVLAPAALGVSTTAIALPALSADLQLSRTSAAWVLAGFLVTQAMFVPVFGRISDLKGVRSAFAGGMVLILAGSVIAILSSSFAVLLIGRLVQGAGAAGFWVSCQAVIGARYEGAERARVLGAMLAVIGIVSGSGTLIGGVLTDAVSWRAVIVLPAIATIPALACFRLVPETSAARGRLDVVGAALLATSAAMVLLLLESPSMHPGALLVVTFFVVGAAAIGGTVRHTKRTPDGFLPRAVISHPNFALASLAGLSLMAAYVAVLFVAPILLTLHHAWTATHIGLVLVPAAAVGGVSGFVFGRLSSQWDPFRVTAALAGASTLGLLLVGAADGAPVPSVIGLALVLGALTGGNVLLVSRVPLMVEATARNVALGLFTLIFQVGGAIGTATVAGLADPLGLHGAVMLLALVPFLGVFAALRAGTIAGQTPGTAVPAGATGRVSALTGEAS
jgi:MFS family permease